jgi:hypothetical protein
MYRGARTNSGSMVALAFVALCPLIVALGAFAIDLMHVNATKGELQRACDAAALAGASQLHNYDLDDPKGKSVLKAAKTIAALNPVDGKLVDDRDEDVKFHASILEPPSANSGGKVKCDAEIKIRGIFSKIFGAHYQTVTASSVAGVGAAVTNMSGDQAFNVVISMDAKHKGMSDVPSDWFDVGKTFQIDFEHQEGTNGTYTTFFQPANDSAYLRDTMQQGLGAKPRVDGTIPPIKIGDWINITNGTKDDAGLPGKWEGPIEMYQHEQLLKNDGPTIVIPIISGKLTPGTITDGERRQVIGFISLKVTGVSINGQVRGHSWVQSITGNITKTIVKGTSDAGDWQKVDSQAATSLKKNGAAAAHLIQ